MRIHGWFSLSELLALAVLVFGVLAAVCFTVVAGINGFLDRPASLWWWLAAGNAALAFAGWVFL